jgi:glycosyltransferase involved in cell wall biosynthesis
MAPLVSVVMPTFNRMTWLPEALRSVQAQTAADWELLLVDDGSTDETEQWARRLDDSRVRYSRRLHTGSIAAARNAGLQDARGEWTAFLDSDDRWKPRKLAAQLERLAGAGEAAWCYAKYQTIDPQGEPVPQPSGSAWRPFEGMFVDRLLTTEASVVIPTLIVRTALARGLMFDERLPLAEDYDFVVRLASGQPGSVVDEVLADVRLHPARTTTLAGPFDGYLGKIMAYRKAGSAIPDPALRRIARRQLRSHTAEYIRRAIRHRRPGELSRLAGALWHS